MNHPQKQRRAAVIGVSAAAAAAAAFGVFGVADHDGVAAQQRDVVLTAVGDGAIPVGDYNAADTAHANLVDAQVAQDGSLFDQQIAWQESIYYWAQQNNLLDLFAVGDGSPASSNLLNGAFTRFSEALVVGQANQQAHWDHLLGVNQTLGAGGYEHAIGDQVYADLNGSGIDPSSSLGEALSAINDPTTQESFSAFTGALDTLQGALYQSAFEDVLGAFTNF